MTTLLLVALTVGVCAAAALVAPWTLWPLVVRGCRPALLPRRRTPSAEARVSVLVPARNEADCIVRKVGNTLAQEGLDGRLELLIGDDASTDGTGSLASAAGDVRVRVIRNDERRGKVATLERLVHEASGDIVVFSDASAMLEAGALRAIVDALEDAGAAGIRYAVGSAQRDAGSSGSEASWWRGQTKLRATEAPRDALLGLHGACWGAWRSLVPRIPHDTINDDYVLPLLMRAEGHRVAYVPELAAWDVPTSSRATQRARWRRIARGNVQMLWRYRHLFAPRRGRVAANLLLQKAARTAGPVLLGIGGIAAIVATFASVSLLPQNAQAPALGALALAAAGVIAFVVANEKVMRMVRFAADAQWSYAQGIADGFRRDVFGRAPARGWERADAVPTGRASVPCSVRYAKRALDVVASVCGLALGAPIALLVALAIRLDSRGPAIYAQERVCASPGADGPRERTFVMHKFRTMRVDAESASGPTWAVDDDPRVTRVGRVLRKMRLDELPQLWDVLRGDMSLVGPRPERPHFTAQLTEAIPGYTERLAATKPGITGWAQVRCAYDTSVDSVRTKVLYDMAYCAHLYRFGDWARMEASILAETVVVALTGKGAK